MSLRAGLGIVALALTFCGAAQAAPCVGGGLASYLGLGAGGCTIGNTQFSDFSLPLLGTGVTGIDTSAVTVVPIGGTAPGFSFLIPQQAAATDLFGLRIGFNAFGLPGFGFTSALATLAGATATGDGVTTFIGDLCLGQPFTSADTLACAGIQDALVTLATDGFSMTDDTRSFAFVSAIGVVADFAVDGGLAGTASLGGGDLRFAAAVVPEPGTAALLAIAFGTLVLVRLQRPA
jgi:hypothetical protein